MQQQDNFYDFDLLKLGFEGEKGITSELFDKFGKIIPKKKIITAKIVNANRIQNFIIKLITNLFLVCSSGILIFKY